MRIGIGRFSVGYWGRVAMQGLGMVAGFLLIAMTSVGYAADMPSPDAPEDAVDCRHNDWCIHAAVQAATTWQQLYWIEDDEPISIGMIMARLVTDGAGFIQQSGQAGACDFPPGNLQTTCQIMGQLQAGVAVDCQAMPERLMLEQTDTGSHSINQRQACHGSVLIWSLQRQQCQAISDSKYQMICEIATQTGQQTGQHAKSACTAFSDDGRMTSMCQRFASVAGRLDQCFAHAICFNPHALAGHRDVLNKAACQSLSADLQPPCLEAVGLLTAIENNDVSACADKNCVQLLADRFAYGHYQQQRLPTAAAVKQVTARYCVDAPATWQAECIATAQRSLALFQGQASGCPFDQGLCLLLLSHRGLLTDAESCKGLYMDEADTAEVKRLQAACEAYVQQHWQAQQAEEPG